MTSTEGDDLQQVKVESVIVGPGERYDFLIFANDPLEIGSYVIRVETTEYYYNTTVSFFLKLSPYNFLYFMISNVISVSFDINII